MLDLHRIFLSCLRSFFIRAVLVVFFDPTSVVFRLSDFSRFRLLHFERSHFSNLGSSGFFDCSFPRFPDSGRSCLVMSADDRRDVRGSSDENLFRFKHPSIEPSRRGLVLNGDDPDGSVHSQSEFLPSGNLIIAPVSATKYLDTFRKFLLAWKLAEMHQDGEKLDCIGARYGGKNDTAFYAWKKRWQVFHCNGAVIIRCHKLPFDMLFFRCLENRQFVVRL